MSKPIDDALNTTSDGHSYVQKFNKHKDVPDKKDHGAEIDKDYQYSRAQLYNLIEKGQETPVSYTHLTLPTKRIV